MNSDYLPEDVLLQIFLLLPLISILRCKSVCKSWLSIIRGPRFIQAHLSISNTKQASLFNNVAVLSYKHVMKDVERTLVGIQSGEYVSSILLPPKFQVFRTLIGYCNGLFCLADYVNEGICVWNPAIKCFKMLPTPHKKINWKPSARRNSKFPPPLKKNKSPPVRLGFGYDSLSDDYKFIRMVVSSKVAHAVEAELYSVNANCWKEIELPDAVQNILPFIEEISLHAVDGVLYMAGLGVLVSFNFHNEVFQMYSYPDSMNQISAFLDFEGSIAMIFKTVVANGRIYSLWTFCDVDGKACWTKKFNIELDLEIDRVYLYLGGGQFVAVDYTFGFFLYDLRKKETKRLRFKVYGAYILSVVKYTESLASLPGSEQVEDAVDDSSSEEIMHKSLECELVSLS